MDDDIARQKLIAAQKAWIKYRDAQAELDADSERGGSLANQMAQPRPHDQRIVELTKDSRSK